MSETTSEERTVRSQTVGPPSLKGSAEARRQAAMILEALNGVRTTQEAADAMGIALPRYYLLETRALEGFIEALEPRPRGRPIDAERELVKLREEIERLEREMRRYQALYRTAQRSLGVPSSPGNELVSKKASPSGKGRSLKTRRGRRKSRGEKVLSGLKKPDLEFSKPDIEAANEGEPS